MPTIIYPPTIDYNWLYQRPQQLLKSISKLDYKIIYYNTESYLKQQNCILEVNPNFLICKPSIHPKYLKVDRPIIGWYTYPPHASFVGQFDEDFIVFDALDDASDEFGHWASKLSAISNKADIIFTTSNKLHKYHSSNHKNVHMCKNAADYEHFSKASRLFAERPDDLPKNSNPIIGYIGALASWVDWNLIRYLVLKNKKLNFVFIGPKFNISTTNVKSNNIYYLGRKSYSNLPYYLQYFDVCIVPFKLTTMIEGCNPIKIYEYLSAGKPVVSTNIPEIINLDVIYSAKNYEDFNQKIKIALEERFHTDKIIQRMTFANNNSWTSRAEFVINILNKYINKNYNKSIIKKFKNKFLNLVF